MDFLKETIYKSQDGKTHITALHVVLVGLGMVGLYFIIPERKRKNLFK